MQARSKQMLRITRAELVPRVLISQLLVPDRWTDALRAWHFGIAARYCSTYFPSSLRSQGCVRSCPLSRVGGTRYRAYRFLHLEVVIDEC